MAQSWKHLLFAHWPVPEAAIRPAVPEALPIDTYDGQAWIAVTPFKVRALRLHGTPPIPIISSFLETNVRTYVTLDDKPGIYFFSRRCRKPTRGRLSAASLPPALLPRQDGGDRVPGRPRRL